MRYPRLVCSILFLGLAHGSLQAQTVLYQARVKASETLVRSGPSLDAKIYPTNNLKRGDVVKVIKDREDGWLEIVPPTGSFSWVNQLLVEPVSQDNPNAWSVSEADTKSYYGSRLWSKQPNIVSAKLAKGTLLVSVGPKFTRPDTNGAWLPIKPPPSEVRYVEAKDVEKDEGSLSEGTLVKARATARGQESEPPDPTLPPSGREVANPPTRAAAVPDQASSSTPATVVEAQQAERMGDREKAIKLWIEVGRAYEKENNLNLRNQCYGRADWLKQQTRVSRPQNSCCIPCTPAQQRCWPGTMDNRLSVVPASRLEPVAAQPASNVYSGARSTDTVTWNPARPQPSTDSTLNNIAPANIFRGYLASAYSTVDGKRAYLLHSPNNRLSYVVAEPGVDLERYLRSNVELEGAKTYRSDLRVDLLRAVSVKGLQQ
ncbi:MAG TPA: hypothetical protein VGZ25_11585 [Gemmataceae bacterium]|nr:hypothetical protein [Gemmataceae bacterium]